MDCVMLKTYALPGKPTAVGHIGTVTATPQPSGEILVEFILRRKGMRHLRLDGYQPLEPGGRRKRLDVTPRQDQNT